MVRAGEDIFFPTLLGYGCSHVDVVFVDKLMCFRKLWLLCLWTSGCSHERFMFVDAHL